MTATVTYTDDLTPPGKARVQAHLMQKQTQLVV